MKQSVKKIFAEQKDIRVVANHFVTVNLKIKKTDVSSKLKNGILSVGVAVDKSGKPAVGGNAFGLVFEDVDFENSSGTEVVPVLVHGIVSKAKVREYSGEDVSEDTIKTLNLIKFI